MSRLLSCAVFETAPFERALREDRFETWFQPIVDTNVTRGNAGEPFILAHECLIRLFDGRLYGDAEILEAAQLGNEIRTFDSYARSLAIRSAASQQKNGRYFIGFAPASIRNLDSCMKITQDALDESGMRPENIVFEVAESDLVRDPGYARRIRDFIGRRGFGFALDDTGTWANSLRIVCDLQPDYMKLDKSLVRNVERPLYAGTIRGLVELADRFGAGVIAKGVERTRTTENLWLLGIRYMQGYLFGSPAPETLNPPVCRERVVSISGRRQAC